MIAYMDNSSKLFPYELYLGFTLLKNVTQGQEVLDITGLYIT